MTPLLTKDLRLALDALLPWALIVIGSTLVGGLIAILPAGMRPSALQSVSLEEVVAVGAGFASITAIAMGSWIGAVVAQGDQSHGAAHLVAGLPVSYRRRCGAKLASIVLAALVPALYVLASIAFTGSLRDQSGPSLIWSYPLPPLVCLATLTGAGLALLVAPLVIGAFRVVALSLLFGAGACLAGLVGSRVAFDLSLAMLSWNIHPIVAGPVIPIDEVSRSMDQAAAISTLVVLGVVAAVGIVLGIGLVTRPVRRRTCLACIGACLIGAFGLGAAVTAGSVDSIELLRESRTYALSRYFAASDDELAALLRAGPPAGALWGASSAPDQIDRAIVETADSRVRSLPIAARRESVVYRAIIESTTARGLDARSALLRRGGFDEATAAAALEIANTRFEEWPMALLALAQEVLPPEELRARELGNAPYPPYPSHWLGRTDDGLAVLDALAARFPAQQEAIAAVRARLLSPPFDVSGKVHR